jgi:dTDP-4-dehydrorhamnose reductase
LAERGHEVTGTYCAHPFPGLVRLCAAEREPAATWLKEQKPDVVFYPAGFTWVDGCEADPARALDENRDQPLALALAAAEVGARFVYFSTDYVFDGRSGPYDESAEPRPLSAYGRAKLDAEMALEMALGPVLLTIRTTWVFGPERQGKNFAYQLARTLSERKPLVCPSDQISNPSYGPDVARAVVLLVEREESGLFHVAGPETMSRPAFARALAEGFGLDPKRIEERETALLGQAALRPLQAGLLTPRLDAVLPGAMRPLAEALADFRALLASGDDRAAPIPRAPEAYGLPHGRWSDGL